VARRPVRRVVIKVVGEPTAGWIIYSGATELVDGSSMRLPGTGADGKEMEKGKDSQLDVAVRELLQDIAKR